MGCKLQFRRGTKASLPVLAPGEPAFVTDEGRLYLGTGSGSIPMARRDEVSPPASAGFRSFTAAQWVPAGGGYTLSVSKAEHGRQSSRFGYTVRHLVGGKLLDHTWAALGVEVNYMSTGEINLSSRDAFPGEIIFIGA